MTGKRGERHLYGPDHVAERKAWVPHVNLGTVHCWRCGTLIDPAQGWDLGHRDGLPRHPEHRHCNRGAGATYGNHLRATATPNPPSRSW